MPTLTPPQIAKALDKAAWPAEQWVTGIAVALAESGGSTTVTNVNSNGSVDYGLFQINSVHQEILGAINWRDPVQNAGAALAVYEGAGNSWSPWVTYDTGAYRKHLTEARMGAKRYAQNKGIYLPTSTSSGGEFSLKSVGTLFKTLADPTFWLRAGMFVGGTSALAIGLFQLASGTETGARLGEDVSDLAQLALAFAPIPGLRGKSASQLLDDAVKNATRRSA